MIARHAFAAFVSLLVINVACKRPTVETTVKNDTAPSSSGGSGDQKGTTKLGQFGASLAAVAYSNQLTCPADLSDQDVNGVCDKVGCTEEELKTSCSTTQQANLRLAGDEDSVLEQAIFAATFEEIVTAIEADMANFTVEGNGGPSPGPGPGQGPASPGPASAPQAPGPSASPSTTNEPMVPPDLQLTGGLVNGTDLIARAVAAVIDLLYNPQSATAQRWTIPYQRFKPLFEQLVQATTYGVGFGMAGSISATVVGKSLALEQILLPPSSDSNEMTIGYHCNTQLSINTPELNAGVALYGIKAIGCTDHDGYAGDGIGVSFNLGVPLVYGSIGAQLGLGLSVDYNKLVAGIRRDARTIFDLNLMVTETPTLVGFLTSYAREKARDALPLVAATAVGGLFSDVILQNGGRNRNAQARGNNELNGAMQALYNALQALVTTLNTLNRTNLITTALDDVIRAMGAYETANRVTLTRAKALATILKETIGCGSVSAGISGSVGLGTREDTPSPVSFGAAASIGKAHILAQLRATSIRTLIGNINRANDEYARTRSAIQDSLTRLNEAVRAREVLDEMYRQVQGCIDATTVEVFGRRIPPPPAAVAACLGLSGSGIAIAREALSGNMFTRLSALRDSANRAGDGFRGATATANAALGVAQTLATDISRQIAQQLGPILRSTARCAVDTATVPFATTIIDGVTGGD